MMLVKIINKEYHIWAPQKAVWDALVNPKMIEKWSQLDSSSNIQQDPVRYSEGIISPGGAGKTHMSDKEGFKFSLWGGDIHGTNLTIIPRKKLVQEWYSSDDPGHATKVTFTLTHKDGCTTLYLKHEGVREKNYDSIDKGWDDYYLGEIKKLLEK